MIDDSIYLRRCLNLANRSKQNVFKNPNVGAIIVYKNQVIGEGYHKIFGGPHAEVQAINSVPDAYKHMIKDSTLYISLEPCCINSKTPACTNLILNHKINKVVIGALDPNPLVKNKSVALLKNKGVSVAIIPYKDDLKNIIQAFKVSLGKKRPFITLKIVKSVDNYIGKAGSQMWLSNQYSSRFSHKLRSENDAVLIGTNTAKIDDPRLNNRYFGTKQPIRIIIDKELSLNPNLRIFDNSQETMIINIIENSTQNKKTRRIKVEPNPAFTKNYLQKLINLNISRLLVEGGSTTINYLIKSNFWDQAYIIQTPVKINSGIKAPNIEGLGYKSYDLHDNKITEIVNNNAIF